MVEFEGKKILLIAPYFFGYEQVIKRELAERGGIVDYLQENIDSASFFQKMVNKLPEKEQSKIRATYFINLLKSYNLSEYDYVFGIRLDLFNKQILEYLKEKCKKAYFILYFWDSVSNMRNPGRIARYFDKVYTFDPFDYKQNKDKGWLFRPLFYTNEYAELQDTSEKDIDILMVASLSPSRANVYLLLKNYARKHGLKLVAYFYIKPYVYFVNMFKNSGYRKIVKNVIHSHGISTAEICKLLSRTKCVFDCASPTQTGLTMRTIECLGARKKIITTNDTVRNYDFYNNKNIKLFSEKDMDSVLDFINGGAYQKLSDDIYFKYSIKGWIEEIFDI